MAAWISVKKHFSSSTRSLRLIGLAGLAVVAVTAACGKLSSSDITGSSSDDAAYTITISLAAESTPPSSNLGFTVSVKDKDGVIAKDGTTLKLSGDGLGTVTPTEVTLTSGQATATFTAGATEGTSTITVKYDSDTKQTASVKIDKNASVSTGNGSSTDTGDEFPYGIENIQWDNRGLNMDVGSWDVNAEITSAYHSGHTLHIENNCSDVWRHRQDEGWSKPSVGNYWLIGKVHGEWHAATVDWAGVNKSGMNDLNLDGDAGMYSDLADWRPVEGEEAFVMMSTHARAYVDSSNKHRTQIVRITMHP